MRKNPLKIFAGAEALNHIRKNGLKSNDISMVLGASGGPNWLSLIHIDRYLLDEWFKKRERPLHVLGTSSGAWRFACYPQKNPLAAHARLQDVYMSQDYAKDSTPDEIAWACKKMIDTIIPGENVQEIIDNPMIRYHALVVRCLGMAGSYNKILQTMGILFAWLSNAVNPRAMRPWIERVLFHHPDKPPINKFPDLPARHVEITPDNVKDSVLASGSIPIVVKGVRNIIGAPGGVYRDGGLIDYQFDFPALPKDGFVLYPHYTAEPPIGSWFNKRFPARLASREHYKRTIIIAPSNEFVATLPGGRLPDLDDFYEMKYPQRRENWDKAVLQCEHLREILDDIHTKQQWAQYVEPLPW